MVETIAKYDLGALFTFLVCGCSREHSYGWSYLKIVVLITNGADF